MLIYPADRITEIEEARKFGIEVKIARIDFGSIMERMRKAVTSGRNFLLKEIRNSKNLDFYHEAAHFSGDYTLELKRGIIKGKKIFIASGSRPFIPPIKGLNAVGYLTNESVLGLKKRPKSIVIIGGGYIGVEYGHFFAAMGTRVTVLGSGDVLVSGEEPEISILLENMMKRRMDVHTGVIVTGVKKNGGKTIILAKDKKSGRTKKFTAERVMVATGRVSNAGLLKPENTGVMIDERGYIKVDDHLRTSRENIWAVGDIIGRQMFTHAGDKEAKIAWHNATHDKKMKMDFTAVPHAVFSHPQIASVGLTEAQARKKYTVLVGKATYSDIVAGDTMAEKEGFAKAIVEKGSRRLLGFHVIGPYASFIIQEAANVIADKGKVNAIIDKMHTFPTLPELIPEALGKLE
jgi:dihydrolipoamide dehydrogenase